MRSPEAKAWHEEELRRLRSEVARERSLQMGLRHMVLARDVDLEELRNRVENSQREITQKVEYARSLLHFAKCWLALTEYNTDPDLNKMPLRNALARASKQVLREEAASEKS